jgi:hypothetical protein
MPGSPSNGPMSQTADISSRRKVAALAFAALCAIVIAIGGLTSPADATSAHTIGNTKHTPRPSCPGPKGNSVPVERQCQVMGEVTGFQAGADHRKRGLMKVPNDGHIVGWSVDLAHLRKSQRKTFADILGDMGFKGKPTARIAVLKRVKSGKTEQYKLKKKSPTIKLSPYYHSKPYFTLNNPLKVRKGEILALTTRTWVPNFAHKNLSNNNRWKASRSPHRCNSFKDLTKRSKPQEKVDSIRRYGCTYRRARLLYWGYFVRS